jgi:hypothetical protein
VEVDFDDFLSKHLHFAIISSMGRESRTSIKKKIFAYKTFEEKPPKISLFCSKGIYAGFQNMNLP